MNRFGLSFALVLTAGCSARGLVFPSEATLGEDAARDAALDLDDETARLGDAAPRADAAVRGALVNVQRAGDGFGSVASDPQGIDCGEKCTASFPAGAVTLIAVAMPGSDFVGWSGACEGSGECQLELGDSMSSTTQVVAIFALRRGEVRVLRTGSGTGTVTGGQIDCGAQCSEKLLEGTVFELTATPMTGSRLGGWTGCTDMGSSCSLIVGQGIQLVTARFEPCTTPASDSERFVDSVNGMDAATQGGGPGTCAYRTIRYALDRAPREVHLAPGSYPVVSDDYSSHRLTGRQMLIGDPSDVGAVRLRADGVNDEIVEFAGTRNGVRYVTMTDYTTLGLRGVVVTTRPLDAADPHLVEHSVFERMRNQVWTRGGGARIRDNVFRDGATSAIQWDYYPANGPNPAGEIVDNDFGGAPIDVQCTPLTDPNLTGHGNQRAGGPILCGCTPCAL